jgi:hypothetical protein
VNNADPDFEKRQKNVDLYGSRYDLGQNIFTGEPLTGESRKEWEKIQANQRGK